MLIHRQPADGFGAGRGYGRGPGGRMMGGRGFGDSLYLLFPNMSYSSMFLLSGDSLLFVLLFFNQSLFLFFLMIILMYLGFP